jgi:TolB-like protein/Flp pilus assembly protein TadD
VSAIKSAGALAVLTIVLLAGCREEAAGPPPRYAVLRFENLSGDPAFDWAGRAVSEDLTHRLNGAMDGPFIGTTAVTRVNVNFGGRPASAPGISAERAAAAGAGATRAITGYLLKSGSGVRLVSAIEDLGTHKILRLTSATGKSVLDAIGAAAGELAAKPRSGITAHEAALHNYSMALETPLDQQAPLLETAIDADPKLGSAWTYLVRLKARQNRADGIATADRAIEQKLEPIDTAAIELEKAELESDRPARIDALRRFVALNPGDILLLRSLAEQESVAGGFARAADDWRKVLLLLPADVSALNQAAYNYAWAGNYPEAVRAINEYAQIAPRDANPLDSLGDINYWFKRFPEAAANYKAAHDKDPKMLNGGDLYKAAWARLRSGDQKAADDLVNQYVKLRQEAGDRALPVLHADWLYQTGREQDAEAMLRKEGASPKDPAQRVLIFSELAIWDLVAGKRTAALADLQNGGPIVTPTVVTARFAAQPSASAAEWEARAAKLFAAPQLAALRDTALSWALILDGKKEAARELWEKLAAERPATDFFGRDILTRLKGDQIQHPAPPDPREVNQFAAVLSRL